MFQFLWGYISSLIDNFSPDHFVCSKSIGKKKEKKEKTVIWHDSGWFVTKKQEQMSLLSVKYDPL